MSGGGSDDKGSKIIFAVLAIICVFFMIVNFIALIVKDQAVYLAPMAAFAILAFLCSRPVIG